MDDVIRGFGRIILIGYAAVNAVWFTVYTFQEDDRWFSRLFLVVMCIGFLYVGAKRE